VVLAWPIALALVVGWAYRDVPFLYFTGPDSFPLIEASRIQSWTDLWNVVSQPLMAGTGFESIGLFYRPLASLSFAANYSWSGLNPWSYHLVNMALHLAVSLLLVQFLASLLPPPSRIGAWLGGLLFALHPVAVEVVYVPAHRQDSMAALFLLLALGRYRAWRTASGPGRWALATSLFCYLLALASKEIAIIFPVLVVLMELQGPSAGWWDRLWQRRRAMVWTAVATVLWLIWRYSVLRSVGGYGWDDGGDGTASLAVWIIPVAYLLDLVCPLAVVGLWSRPLWLVETLSVVVTIGALLAGTAWFWRYAVPRTRGDRGRGEFWRQPLPWLCWSTFTALPVYVVFQIFSHRLMYVPALFCCAAIAVAAVRLMGHEGSGCSAGPAWSHRCRAILLLVIVASIVITSPVLHRYEYWPRRGEVTEQFFHHIRSLAERTPAGQRILVHHMTETRGQGSPQSVEMVPFFEKRTVSAWVHLHRAASLEITLCAGGEAQPSWGRPLAYQWLGRDGALLLFVTDEHCLGLVSHGGVSR
jgi:hypothetical protein